MKALLFFFYLSFSERYQPIKDSMTPHDNRWLFPVTVSFRNKHIKEIKIGGYNTNQNVGHVMSLSRTLGWGQDTKSYDSFLQLLKLFGVQWQNDKLDFSSAFLTLYALDWNNNWNGWPWKKIKNLLFRLFSTSKGVNYRYIRHVVLLLIDISYFWEKTPKMVFQWNNKPFKLARLMSNDLRQRTSEI